MRATASIRCDAALIALRVVAAASHQDACALPDRGEAQASLFSAGAEYALTVI
jgi:hypothetical protein